MSSGIDCGQLDKVLESIFQIPVDAAKLDKWVNGGEFETVMLGGKDVPTLRNLVRQIDERESQAAEEEINKAKQQIGVLAAKIQAKIDDLKAMTATAETLPPGHPATVYYNAGTGEFEFGIPQGKQGIQGERGQAPIVDIIFAGDPSDEALNIIYGGDPSLTEQGDKTFIRQVNRIGTSAAWVAANPVLEDGEVGYERAPGGRLLWKIGDGTTPWNDLPYPPILIDTIYRFRGSVDTVEDLPDGAAEGDVYNVTSTGANYAWTGEIWDNLGVVQEIDPAPIKDSGNPVASGGVFAALEEQREKTDGLEEAVAEHGEAIEGLRTDVSGLRNDVGDLQGDVSDLQAQLPISNYQGATEEAAGVAGLVPPAAPEEKDYVLHGDGTWKESAGGKAYTNGTGLDLVNNRFSVKYGKTAGTALEGNAKAVSAENADHAASAGTIDGTLPVSKGGTGATTAAQARINLGVTGIVSGVAVTDGYDAVNHGSGNVVTAQWWQTEGSIASGRLTLRAKLRTNYGNCNCNCNCQKSGGYC